MTTQLNQVPRSRAAAVVAAIAALLGATPAMAMTTAELRAACQTSPGNVVVLTQPVTILEGPRPPSTEQVLTGCTIVLGANAKLATEGISMTFAGPLAVQSTAQTELKLTRSFLAASSINFNLTGAGTVIETTASGVHATAGGLLITVGNESTLTVLDRLRSGPQEALAAATTIQIRSGQKFTGQLSEMRISAPQGFDVVMNGAEGLLSVKQVWITAAQGHIGITSSTSKTLVDLSETNLGARTMLSLRLAGAESGLKLQQVGMFGASDTQDAPGGILLEVGAGSAEKGSIEASNVAFFNIASVNVRASANGRNGILTIQKSSLNSSGDLVLVTGAAGQTEVKESNGGASGVFRVAAGAGGNCTAESNTIFAPIMQVCP